MKVTSRAPLRLGLSGGGTDVSPYCDRYGGLVLNATLDRYVYTTINPNINNKITFRSIDMQEEESYKLNEKIKIRDKLIIHKGIYNYIIENFNRGENLPLDISTFSDAPAGSGLGSSSAIAVSMVRAYVELLNLALDDYQIAYISYFVERIQCSLEGGRQDQYSATFGGFNFMEFYEDNKVIINPLRIKNWIVCELESKILLFSTEKSRDSAKIIKEQCNNITKDNQDQINAMHGIKEETIKFKESLLKGDFSGIVETFRKGWELKKNTAASVSNAYLNKIHEKAIHSGALAGKVSGAGGGGFMIFLVPIEKRMNVIKELEEFKGVIYNCHFSNNGCQAWHL